MNIAKKEKNSNRNVKAIKGSAIAKHFVNNQNCAKNFNLENFKITENCYNVLCLT